MSRTTCWICGKDLIRQLPFNGLICPIHSTRGAHDDGDLFSGRRFREHQIESDPPGDPDRETVRA